MILSDKGNIKIEGSGGVLLAEFVYVVDGMQEVYSKHSGKSSDKAYLDFLTSVIKDVIPESKKSFKEKQEKKAKEETKEEEDVKTDCQDPQVELLEELIEVASDLIKKLPK